MRENRSDAAALPGSSATAAICWILAGVVYLLAEALAASAFPDYSYAMNYISDLGVPDVEMLGDRAINSPLHVFMNIAFLVHGFLFVTASIYTARGSRLPLRLPIIALGIAHALGMVLIAVVNGGAHNNSLGLGGIHLLGAFLAFVGGHLTAICIGLSLLKRRNHLVRGSSLIGVFSLVIGLVGVLGIVMLQVDVRVIPGIILADGTWERIGMYSIVVWEMIIGIVLIRDQKVHRAQPKVPALD
ncbi:DUF998 domain-containing protein [Brevibacterium sp. UCMA 11754]|uniref:DUF998 domain-containing protein n=1 Tax=Brevibacterium sp. UCMA 11754 TaxID=2749198 RepID=UPI001F216997|nr:DUF998 domain-containing protein [Brevibacterium sp. UCMA 11754]MCF2571233.1 DUF998 domain-containing protein [Brevibacterium sp. UCMA 11754]